MTEGEYQTLSARLDAEEAEWSRPISDDKCTITVCLESDGVTSQLTVPLSKFNGDMETYVALLKNSLLYFKRRRWEMEHKAPPKSTS